MEETEDKLKEYKINQSYNLRLSDILRNIIQLERRTNDYFRYDSKYK